MSLRAIPEPTAATTEPFFFGEDPKRLYGCHHPPRAGLDRGCGVVLCSPFGQESIRAHRTYLQLALRLSRVGFHVLRFDYYGCGDSAGETEDGNIGEWVQSISTAIAEMRTRATRHKVCLFGLRLGATLAMMAGAPRSDVDALILWDPVIDGESYLADLRQMHRERLGKFRSAVSSEASPNASTDLLGLHFSEPMLSGLAEINLLELHQPPLWDILLIESEEGDGAKRLRDHLKSAGLHPEHQYIPSSRVWDHDGKALVAAQVIQAAVSWISEADS